MLNQTDRVPTEEQQHILEVARTQTSNVMIRALAGTGKTATLEMIDRAVSTKPILYLVFNKRNAKEAEKRMLSTTTVRTFNSLGHRIWARSCGKSLSLNTRKTQDILRGMIQDSPKPVQGDMWDVYWDVVDAVGRAKALGYVPEDKFPNAKRLISQTNFHMALESEPDDLVADLIDAVLVTSVKMAYDGTIDYNDQIYMPALFGGVYPQFPLVLVDEYQDLNPTNHAMIAKLAKRRLIGVGDPYQNIYQFRGAAASGMTDAEKFYDMTKCDLSVSFRCPSAIVDYVKPHVPHFKAYHQGGAVNHLTKLPHSEIEPGATIICRNNAPLLSVAFKLLSAGHSVSVAGSDIGPKLIGIMKRLGGPEDCKQQAFLGEINEWESAKLIKGSTSAADLAACMRVFASITTSKATAIAYAEHLFKQEGSIQLLTGHKSKGLEFDTVYHLDPWLLKDNQADRNLSYVISTRSKDRLFEINSAEIEW